MQTKYDTILYLQQPLERWPRCSLWVLGNTTTEIGKWELSTEGCSAPYSDIYGAGWKVRITIPNGDSLIWPMPQPGYSFCFTMKINGMNLRLLGMTGQVPQTILWLKLEKEIE